MAPRPKLIVVTGQPGSGKTTLAHALAREIRCPAICRDEIKEGMLYSGDGSSDERTLALEVYETFFATIRLLLERRVSLIAEAAFQHKLWSPQIEPLRAMADVRIVLCSVSDSVASDRRITRAAADSRRDTLHPDALVRAARAGQYVASTRYDPPHLDVPTLTVSTQDGYHPTLSKIADFFRRHGESAAVEFPVPSPVYSREGLR